MKDIGEKEDLMCSTDSDDMDQEKTEHRTGKMFIGGLHSQTDTDGLENHFKQYGEIKECIIMRDPSTKRSRGFGFVTFVNPSSVDKVAKKTNHIIDGKKVDPKIAIPRKGPNLNQAWKSNEKDSLIIKLVLDYNKFKKIFIGGLANDTTPNDVREYFEKYGKVTDVLLMYDKHTRRLRGFGFVSFESEEVAKRICGEGFHKIKSKSVECKRAQPKEVMQALQGRGRAGPYFGVDLSHFSIPRWYTQYGTPMPFYSSQAAEWPPMNAHMYQQLAKMEGFHNFPPGGSGYMNMSERRTETSPQHGYYRSSFGSIRSPDVRPRSDPNPQSNSVSTSSMSTMQDYDYGVPINQYHQHGQGNLAPNPSPLSHAPMNPINSPGPVEYISATRTGAAAAHDFAIYSNSLQGFGNGMTSLRQ